MSKPDKRPETGVIQFGGDWPGVFLRGDYAIPMAMCLGQVLEAFEKTEGMFIQKRALHDLQKLLSSCDARVNPEVQTAILTD